jgi:iron-sulfur cluster assembly protein
MIKLTEDAANQILQQAKQSGVTDDPLRIAVRQGKTSGFQYLMGFDEFKEGDNQFEVRGVKLVIADNDAQLVTNMEVDYVEIEGENKEFIFKNPNDPNYKPPGEL